MYYNARQNGRISGGEKKKWIPWLLLLGSILLVSTGIYYGVKALFFQDSGTFREVSFVPEDGVGYIRFKNSEQWNKFQRNLTINEGESVQSGVGKNIHLDFFNGTKLYLDMGAEVTVEKSTEIVTGELAATVNLQKGTLWAEIKPQTESTSIFRVSLPNNLYIESTGGTVVVSLDALRVLGQGNSSAEIFSIDTNGKISFSKKISVGQQVDLSPSGISSALSQHSFAIAPISPEFYATEFYLARAAGSFLVVPSVSPSPSVFVSPSPEIEGAFSAPEITSPGNTGESVEVTKNPITISGTAPKGTQKIYVNDYALAKFAPGDTTWKYSASVAIGNLVAGENLFKVVAEGADGEKSKTATITILYKGEGSTTATKTPKGVLKITKPNSGQDTTIETNSITLSGTAPSNAASLQVNDYFLQKFKLGDTVWSYVDKELKEGENVFTVRVFDEQKRFLASDKITITVKKGGATASPSISPTPKPSSTNTPVPSTSEVGR